MFAAARISGISTAISTRLSPSQHTRGQRTTAWATCHHVENSPLPPDNSPKPCSPLSEQVFPPPLPGGSDHHSHPQRQPIFKAEGIWWLRSCFLAPGNKLCNPSDAAAHEAHTGTPGPQGTHPPVSEGQWQKKVHFTSLLLGDKRFLMPDFVPLKGSGRLSMSCGLASVNHNSEREAHPCACSRGPSQNP